MLNPRLVRNQNRKMFNGHRNRGFVLLMMLSVIIIAITAAAVMHLSANNNQFKQKAASLKALAQARDALIGYAMTHQTAAKPPGTIPCPDTDHDGRENITGSACTAASRIGLLPYKDLNVPELFDGTGAPLLYVVASGYAGAPLLPAFPRNSSLKSSLTLDGTPEMVFIVIAPGVPLNGQQPTVTPVAAVNQFLEGDNSDGTYDSYTSLLDDTHNDLLLGVSTTEFWPGIEKLILENVSTLMSSYKGSCGLFPWASSFNAGDGVGIAGTYEGGAPIATASPTDWGTGCAPALPIWLKQNWKGGVYYKICDQPLANPPTSSCLKLHGSSGAITNAKVIAIAPGIPLSSTVPPQNRGSITIPNFFEGLDKALPSKLDYDNITPTINDNDLITIVAP